MAKQRPQTKRAWIWLPVGLVLAAVGAAAVWQLRPSHRAIPSSVEEMLAWPDEDLDFGLAALVLTKKYFPRTDVRAGLAKLDDFAFQIRAALSGRGDRDQPSTRIGAINSTLYLRHGFRYDHSDETAARPENRVLGTLLDKKDGSCANLYQLYYAVSERLDFPIDVAEAPQHFYLRYELPDGSHQNIEPTSGGGSATDDELIADMEVPAAAIQSGWFLRPVSKREAIALLLGEDSVAEVRRSNWAEGYRLARKLSTLLPRDGANWFNLALAEAHQAKESRNATEATALTQSALEHARRARELGISKPLAPGYIERQRDIARWRKIDPERAERETKLDQDWDPVAVIAGVAHGKLLFAHADEDEDLAPSVLADKISTINAANERPSLQRQADLVGRARLASGLEQQRLLLQLAGVPSSSLPVTAPTPSVPSAPVVEVP